MGMKLKTCLASMAMLAATAAHAEGAASSSPPAEGGTTYRSAEPSAGQGPEYVTDWYPGSAHRQAAGGQEHPLNPSDEHAGAGGGSGELKVDRSATSPTEKEVGGNWNRQEFLRNTWSTP
jgi:hypothetical protein